MQRLQRGLGFALLLQNPISNSIAVAAVVDTSTRRAVVAPRPRAHTRSRTPMLSGDRNDPQHSWTPLKVTKPGAGWRRRGSGAFLAGRDRPAKHYQLPDSDSDEQPIILQQVPASWPWRFRASSSSSSSGEEHKPPPHDRREQEASDAKAAAAPYFYELPELPLREDDCLGLGRGLRGDGDLPLLRRRSTFRCSAARARRGSFSSDQQHRQYEHEFDDRPRQTRVWQSSSPIGGSATHQPPLMMLVDEAARAAAAPAPAAQGEAQQEEPAQQEPAQQEAAQQEPGVQQEAGAQQEPGNQQEPAQQEHDSASTKADSDPSDRLQSDSDIETEIWTHVADLVH